MKVAWFGLAALGVAWGAPPDRCMSCHPRQTASYTRTGMANSLGRPNGQPVGAFRHRQSNSQITIANGPSGMTHRVESRGVAATYDVDYFVGSGRRGRSYLVSIGDRLFQSPASYYAKRQAWDISPGFDLETDLDFDRPIPPECVFCHAGSPRPVAFTTNQYASPPFEAMGITCERCHGDSDAHVAKPATTNIINPARLDSRRRDAVCEQCHLGGEARIPNPGMRTWDFRPGQALEDVVSVYVFDESDTFKVVSHSEQLALSRCATQSAGRMWCGSCHDPHEQSIQSATYYRQRCQQCHSSASLAGHRKPDLDCAGCHMPQRAAYDGGHTAFTDHRIRKKPVTAPSAKSAPGKLRPWRVPDSVVARRNLGLAYISVGERYQSPQHLDEGFRHLSSIEAAFPDDPAVLTSLAAVLQKKNVPAEAARRFLRASRLEPGDARHQLNLAIALAEAGSAEQAISAGEKAISLDRSLRDAYLLVAELYTTSGNRQKSDEILRRFLEFMPQSISVRLMRKLP
jgi:tetratricopeptide (TPR) repeat protein